MRAMRIVSIGAALGLAASMASPADAAHPRWARYAPVLAVAESLQLAGWPTASLHYLDSLLAVAGATANQDLRFVATTARGRIFLDLGRADEADAAAQSIATDLEQRRDTVGICRVLTIHAGTDRIHGRRDEARAGYDRAIAMARAARLRGEQGRALTGLGMMEFEAEQSDAAARHLREAIALLAAPAERRPQAQARAQLARALTNLHKSDEARREYTLNLAASHAIGDRIHEAMAYHGLGVLDLTTGDPSKAAAQFSAALAIYRQADWMDGILNESDALAVVYLNQSRYSEAESTLTGALAMAGGSAPIIRAGLYSKMGVVRKRQRRYAEAIAYGRRAMALEDSIHPRNALNNLYPLLGTFEAMSRWDSLVAILDHEIISLGPRLQASERLELIGQRAIYLRAWGRAREALPVLRERAGDWREIPKGAYEGTTKMTYMAELARCYHDLGQRDSALVWFSRLTDQWDRWRSQATDPAWREHFDDFARGFSGGYAATLLDPRGSSATVDERAREAFGVLQRFRARTLADRIADPAARNALPPRTITALELQQRVLKPGEAFVDIHAMTDTAFAFVITRSAIRSYGFENVGLVSRLDRLVGLLADPKGQTSSLPVDAASNLGAQVLGPAADLLRPSRRILIAAGAFARRGLEMLSLPNEREALIATREVTFVPSAAMLAQARAASPSPAPHALLALAQSSPWQGVALPGARREAEWLAHRFAGADAVVDRAIASDAIVAGRASRYTMLHIAGHTRSGGDRPWQDAIRLGTSAGEDAWLTAAETARLRIPARICVLAGCRTAGSSSLGGETLEGLATAWLAAGTRTVIATQWAVDDEATSELMRRFYARLARGEGAGEALHGAQLETRGLARFARPYFWAGVVLFGDPDTHVTLTRRGNPGARVTSGL